MGRAAWQFTTLDSKKQTLVEAVSNNPKHDAERLMRAFLKRPIVVRL